MYMINFCLYYKRAKPGRTIFTNPYDNFWDWDDFNSFLIFVVGLWAGLSIMTYAMMTNLMFVEVLGFLALGLEACLGLPQLFRNCKRRSVEGLSVYMILGWLAGDSLKTWYFISKEEPMQFTMCGILQVLVDLLILGQILVFSDKNKAYKIQEYP